MSAQNDGGPAFPARPGSQWESDGMSLRDWFAGQALAGISASVASASLHNSAQTPPDDVIARWAYDYAAAMLTVRQGGRP